MERQKRHSLVVSMITIAAALAPLAAPALCAAQGYPSKPIRFISATAAGTQTDLFYRLVCEGLASALGQPVITDNRPGAGSLIALEAIAKSPPDGHTIGIGSAAALAIGPFLQPAPYDPVKSFSHITLLNESTLTLAVRTGLKINSVQELIAYARANPGKLNFGSIGVGSTSHLGLELLKIKAGLQIVHIPFKSNAGVLQAIRTNEIDLVVNTPTTSLQLQQQGVARSLATLAASRDPVLPDVPSSIEAGIPEVLMPNWTSIIGPAGLSREIVQRINRATVEHLAKPDVAAKATQIFLPPKTSTPEELSAILASTIARYKEVIERAAIKVD
jgi:tripartite-type tricarboxylate transporter receptor subunit TctC